VLPDYVWSNLFTQWVYYNALVHYLAECKESVSSPIVKSILLILQLIERRWNVIDTGMKYLVFILEYYILVGKYLFKFHSSQYCSVNRVQFPWEVLTPVVETRVVHDSCFLTVHGVICFHHDCTMVLLQTTWPSSGPRDRSEESAWSPHVKSIIFLSEVVESSQPMVEVGMEYSVSSLSYFTAGGNCFSKYQRGDNP
jgi:hypothetical protein